MKFLGKTISGKFTIPSGIITTDAKVIERIATEIPEIGVITTKSIGPDARDGNREPILTQYAPGCFMNAVGLTNPGAKEFAEQLKKIKLPKDRFLLTSIFGKDVKEFVEVAKILEPYSDGLELNLSCPHAKGYGMAIGQDPEMVKEITAAVKKAVNVPVVPKLTPNTDNIGKIAKAAVEGGADAICAINTVGPGYFTAHGEPVLTNVKGGMSGKGILPIGLKCIKEISEAFKVPIIGCGGISTAEDVNAYEKAGATIIGVGSATAGMSTTELKEYFSCLGKGREVKLKKADTSFKKYVLVKNKKLADDFSLLVFDKPYPIKAGQFVFAWIPNKGEKPFSILDNDPLTLAIQERGCFSKELIRLKKGDAVYFRGAYGVPIKVEKDSHVVLVGGGSGIAALYQIAKDFKCKTSLFCGAKDKDHLFYLEEFRKLAEVHAATDDGSYGHKGFVTEILKEDLVKMKKEKIVFFNCGPEIMIRTAMKIQKELCPNGVIYNSIDNITKCGIGICGSCACDDGKRLCVDGPFIGGGE